MEKSKYHQCGLCLDRIDGDFLFLYYGGEKEPRKLMDVLNEVYVPNALICRKDFPVWPCEAIADRSKPGRLYVVQFASGYAEDDLVLRLSRRPSKPYFLKESFAKELFPTLVEYLETRIDEESLRIATLGKKID